MKTVLSKLVAVGAYAVDTARSVCGAARDLSQELPPGVVRTVAGKVASVCDVLGLMPEQQQPCAAPVPSERETLVHELEAAVVRGAAGSNSTDAAATVADGDSGPGSDLWRYSYVGSDPTRTDAEDAEAHALHAKRTAAGTNLLPPVARDVTPAGEQ